MEDFVAKVKDFKKACDEFGVISISQNPQDGLTLLVKDFTKIPNVDGVVYKRRDGEYFPLEKFYAFDGIKIFTFGSIEEFINDLKGDDK